MEKGKDKGWLYKGKGYEAVWRKERTRDGCTRGKVMRLYGERKGQGIAEQRERL